MARNPKAAAMKKDVLSAYAGHRLRELRGPTEGVSYQAIADMVGITKPQVFGLINNGNGYGPKVENAMADRFFEGSVDDLHRAAIDWWVTQTQDLDETPDARSFHYEGLKAAVERPVHKSRWSASTIAAAKAMAFAAEDPGEPWWVDQLDKVELALRAAALPLPSRAAASPPLTPAVIERALAEELLHPSPRPSEPRPPTPRAASVRKRTS